MSDTQTKLKPAEENPWYLLATLYGVPEPGDEELQNRNRVTWNRYFASHWTSNEIERLKSTVNYIEFKPFDDQEMQRLADDFRKRSNGNEEFIPRPSLSIDFSGCIFLNNVIFNGYLFSNVVFTDCTFLRQVDFDNCIFINNTMFNNITFRSGVSFAGVFFSL